MTEKRIVAILEDDPASSDALAMIVSDWGAEIVQALTAADIVGILGGRACDIHCVIADFNIAGRPDGVTAARALQAAAPSARVLILTGSLQTDGETSAAAAGYDVIFKPARAEDIIAWLERR